MKCTLFILLIMLCKSECNVFYQTELYSEYHCIGSWYRLRIIDASSRKGSMSKYIINMTLDPAKNGSIDTVELKFDSQALVHPARSNNHCSVKLRNETFTSLQCLRQDHMYSRVEFLVRGLIRGGTPYLKSAKVNGVEFCHEPRIIFPADIRYIIQYKLYDCGRRQLDYTELIFNGQSTKPGDWPWHAAIFKERKTYLCGGTLIRLNIVLTVAHCVTKNKEPLDPDVLTSVLGKYNLKEDDATSQELEVYSVKVHEHFGSPKHLDNDIAILRLKKLATLSDYVQPACLWNSQIYDKLPSRRIIGSVVGWGLDQTNALTSQLKHSYLLERSYAECVLRNPLFYGDKLTNSSKFCAGWSNGTSPCNGDSGGGFMVFVPDVPKDDSSHAPGAWFIKGIVSLAINRENENVCDPNFYVVFTDVTKFNGWVGKHTQRSYP